MIRTLLETRDAWTPLILRLALGIVMFPHGAQKLLGWFGGYGYAGTMGYFTGTVGLPWVVALLVIVIEFFGSLGLILGLGARVAALGVVAVMIGAVLTTHLQVGFFMNWGGSQSGEGFEYHILAITIGVAILVLGAGKWSLDGTIAAAIR